MDDGDRTGVNPKVDPDGDTGSGTASRTASGGELDASAGDDTGADRRAALAAGLILASVAIGFALAPRIVAWADGVSPGLGFPMAVLLFAALGGGFVAVFWLRGRARRD